MRSLSTSLATCAILGIFTSLAVPAAAQTPEDFPRAANGKPDLSGIWQAMNMANWDVEPHSSGFPIDPKLGAMFAIPPGQGVVVGGEIPYLPGMREKQKENFANRIQLDGENKCYLPGVPRATYMPYPFQIIQGDRDMMMVYEYAGGVRVINMGVESEAPAESWMGWSNGKWDGDTLVIDVTSQVTDTWFDRAGNFHGDQLHVVERYTPRTKDTLMYEATIEDPSTFSAPWTIRMPLYRHVEEGAKIIEYKCVIYAEELLYGHLRKGVWKPENEEDGNE